MTNEQRLLPLTNKLSNGGTNPDITTADITRGAPELAMEDTLKALDRSRKALSQAKRKQQNLSLTERISVHDNIIATLQRLTEDTIPLLTSERHRLLQARSNVFANRREDLKRAAEDASWVVTPRSKYDYVGCFKVIYKQERVAIEVGSEVYAKSIDEVDGAKLFAYLESVKKTLDDSHFDRSLFFRTLKDAISLARILEMDRTGKVSIRKLYPLLVLVRQSCDERFLKRPIQKSFNDYSTAQFVYDLARFGRNGWTLGKEQLASQTPNMATIGRGATMTLPSLDGRGASKTQIGAVWIVSK